MPCTSDVVSYAFMTSLCCLYVFSWASRSSPSRDILPSITHRSLLFLSVVVVALLVPIGCHCCIVGFYRLSLLHCWFLSVVIVALLVSIGCCCCIVGFYRLLLLHCWFLSVVVVALLVSIGCCCCIVGFYWLSLLHCWFLSVVVVALLVSLQVSSFSIHGFLVHVPRSQSRVRMHDTPIA